MKKKTKFFFDNFIFYKHHTQQQQLIIESHYIDECVYVCIHTFRIFEAHTHNRKASTREKIARFSYYLLDRHYIHRSQNLKKKKKNTMYATYVTYIQEIYFQEKKNHSAYECVNETIQKS